MGIQKYDQSRRVLLLALTAVLTMAIMVAFVSTAQASGVEQGAQMQANAAKCRNYVVIRGDTLSEIGARFGVTVRMLARANHIRNVNRIYAGQRLCIPKKAASPPAEKKPAKRHIAGWTDPGVAIEVISPVEDGSYHSPIRIIGFSNTFEALVNIRLKDADTGEIVGERFAMGGGVEHKFFDTYIRFETFSEDPQPALLELFEIDPVSGDEINGVEIQLTLLPGQRVLDVWEPAVNAKVCSPFEVAGYSWTFEGNVVLELQDRGGNSLLIVPATGGGTMYDVFSGELNPPGDVVGPAIVSATETSARDGTLIDQTRIPVTILPKCPVPDRPGNG